MYSDRPIPLETILTDFEDFNHTDTDTDFKDEITYQCFQLFWKISLIFSSSSFKLKMGVSLARLSVFWIIC